MQSNSRNTKPSFAGSYGWIISYFVKLQLQSILFSFLVVEDTYINQKWEWNETMSTKLFTNKNMKSDHAFMCGAPDSELWIMFCRKNSWFVRICFNRLHSLRNLCSFSWTLLLIAPLPSYWVEINSEHVFWSLATVFQIIET